MHTSSTYVTPPHAAAQRRCVGRRTGKHHDASLAEPRVLLGVELPARDSAAPLCRGRRGRRGGAHAAARRGPNADAGEYADASEGVLAVEPPAVVPRDAAACRRGARRRRGQVAQGARARRRDARHGSAQLYGVELPAVRRVGAGVGARGRRCAGVPRVAVVRCAERRCARRAARAGARRAPVYAAEDRVQL